MDVLPVLPTKSYSLSDVIDRIETGKNIMSGSGQSPYRILKVSAVTSGWYNENESKPAPDSFDPDLRSIVRVGDFIFSRANTEQLVGATAIVNWTDGHTLLPDKLWRIVWKPSVDPVYMFYKLQSETMRSAVSREATGTSASMRNVSQSKFLAIPVSLPSLAEQRRIVDILDRAESIRRLRKQAQDTARQIIPALFNKMFGDPATNPMGWKQVAIQAVADVQGGLQVTTARANLPLERPYLRVANALRDKLDLSEIKTIRLTPAELERVRLVTSDLLVVEGHGNPLEVGRVAVWDGSISDCVHQNHLIRIRCGREIDPLFLSAILNSAGGRRTLNSRGKTTSGLNTISVSNVKQALVPLPPRALQGQFASASQGVRAVMVRQLTGGVAEVAAAHALQARLLG
jgi:type I restriction enzyme, S subunit